MRTSEQGLALIRQFEGFSATAYRCPAGRLTIGYGHVIREGEDFSCIGLEQAENLLLDDVKGPEQAIGRLVTAHLNQSQFDALAAFIYNVGVQAFQNSTLLRLLNQNDYAGAAGQFGRWAYADGRIIDGLARRRAAEAALFMQA